MKQGAERTSSAKSSSHIPKAGNPQRPTDEKDVSQNEIAAMILKSFSQSLKKLTLYLHQEDGLEKFFGSTLESLKKYHEAYGDLTVTVKPFDFLLGGESVFRDTGQESSVTYKLYRTGIRTFSFLKGVRATEMVDLARILMKPPIELQHEDLAALLWKKNLPHISYLQIQSVEGEVGDADADEDDMERVMDYISEFVSADDPRNAVNFKAFSSLDVNAQKLWANSHTHRKLFGEDFEMSEKDIDYLYWALSLEEEQMALKGADLLYFLIKQLGSLKELEDIQEYIFLLSEHLFLGHHYGSLAMMLDEFHKFGQGLGEGETRVFQQMKGKLVEMFMLDDRLLSVIDFLEETPNLSHEKQADIRLFLCGLGTDIEYTLLSKLGQVSPHTRRLLLQVLLVLAENPKRLTAQLIEQFGKRGDFVLDLLTAGQGFPRIFPRPLLDSFLERKNAQIHSKTVMIYGREYPEDFINMAPLLLKKSETFVAIAIFKILMRHRGSTLPILLEYIESKRFRKLDWKEQMELYGIIGRSQEPETLKFFMDILNKKSGFFRRHVDLHKRLAIKGLEAFGGLKARNVIERQLEKSHHSKEVVQELEKSFQFFELTHEEILATM